MSPNSNKYPYEEDEEKENVKDIVNKKAAYFTGHDKQLG